MSNLADHLCAELKRQLEARSPVAPRIPTGGELLFRWFLDLHQARTYHAAGPNPISHAEILAYTQLMRWPIEPRHVSILRAMDRTYLECQSLRKNDAPEGVKNLPPISSAPLTAGLVDAIFG
ncbi:MULTISPECIES: hypothetical protein [Agrobacterium]|uniref:Uncharacterized protein n=1 Tax=Agrobacterium tumefaciens TaxID=358 RepID=A0AAE6B9B9_AGRTU|nr:MULTISPECIES: hypothetical protein [Agrobacterium]QCL72703.1 hypothetical protein CFBP5499_04190 [Agrobacterium tumefaciens]QCL78277.1 hypothetical protein CFBP5877_03745 [Agrobacterium tumefaciens]CUX15431.1 conserved hypothetical protein [Agrobacterium sp. NCPPB 925]